MMIRYEPYPLPFWALQVRCEMFFPRFFEITVLQERDELQDPLLAMEL